MAKPEMLTIKAFGKKYGEERRVAQENKNWWGRPATYEGKDGFLYYNDFSDCGIPNFVYLNEQGDFVSRSMQEKHISIVDKDPLEIVLEGEEEGGSHVVRRGVPFHAVLMQQCNNFSSENKNGL